MVTNKNFAIIRQTGADLFNSDGRTDTRTDMTEMTFALWLHHILFRY